jgi:uncharacterized metal-binding protein YceD (DUF177 family)
MSKREAMAERPWSVPVALHEVPETGRHLELAADERARAAIARLVGLRSLPRLHAVFDVTRRGRDGLRVVGSVSATVGQTCVVTLEPIENEIEEAIDLVFAPPPPSFEEHGDERTEIRPADAPEPLTGGVVDLGALATEFLILGIDPYPRKPDAVFAGSAVGDGPTNPFAALAALKKKQGGSEG